MSGRCFFDKLRERVPAARKDGRIAQRSIHDGDRDKGLRQKTHTESAAAIRSHMSSPPTPNQPIL